MYPLLLLPGRTLSLNPAWSNPTGQWRVGLKPGFEFFPGEVKRRWQRNAKADAVHVATASATAVREKLAAWTAAKASGSSAADLLERQDLLDQLAALEATEKLEERGPVYDVVAFQDGAGVWRAALDTSEVGSPSPCPCVWCPPPPAPPSPTQAPTQARPLWSPLIYRSRLPCALLM